MAYGRENVCSALLGLVPADLSIMLTKDKREKKGLFIGK